MARKKKKRTRIKNSPSLTTFSVDDLQKKGGQYLHQEKFQDAIKCFKHILKHGDDPNTVQLLAKAYQGRIKSLAAKSMSKEALVLLDAMAQHCGNEGVEFLRFFLQLKAGNYFLAVKLFNAVRTQLDKKKILGLESLFGALLLFDNGLQLKDFPEQSPVVLHFQQAQTVLLNYSENEMEKAFQALQKIPFRSPYRDFRTLMTGFLLWQRDREKAVGILGKIHPSSPYYQFANRFLASLDSPASIFKTIVNNSKSEQRKIRRRYGLNSQQASALEELTDAGGKPVKLYQLVKRHAACFSVKEKNKIIRQILAFCGESSLDILPGRSEISVLEKIQIAALAAENDRMFSYAVEFWDDYLAELETTTSADHKEIALILRYQAKLMEKDEYVFYPNDIQEKYLKSLEFDSSHVATWLKAAKLAGQYTTLNKSYKIINEALEKLPENVEILIAAMKAAGQRGAHKKAGKLARRVLSIDSINTSVLDFLAESHLEHARRLASQKKWQLAEKELNETDTRVKAVRLRGRRLICLGMIFLLQDKEEGLDFIVAGRTENGTTLPAQLLISLESRLYGIPAYFQKRFDQELRRAADGQFERAEFLRLISWLHGFSGKQWPHFKQCCHVLKKYFSKAAGILWNLEESLSICKAFDKAELYVALSRIGEKLLKQFPDDAEIRAYQLIGTIQENKKALTEKQHNAIYQVNMILSEKGKYDLIQRLEQVISDHRDYYDTSSFYESDDIWSDDDLDDEPFKLPQHIIDRLNEKHREEEKSKNEGSQLNLFDDLL